MCPTCTLCSHLSRPIKCQMSVVQIHTVRLSDTRPTHMLLSTPRLLRSSCFLLLILCPVSRFGQYCYIVKHTHAQTFKECYALHTEFHRRWMLWCTFSVPLRKRAPAPTRRNLSLAAADLFKTRERDGPYKAVTHSSEWPAAVGPVSRRRAAMSLLKSEGGMRLWCPELSPEGVWSWPGKNTLTWLCMEMHT